MPPTIRIPTSQVPDLERILGLKKDALQRLRARLDSLKPLPLKFVELQTVFDAALESIEEEGSALVRLLLTWNQLARHREMSPNSIVDALREAVGAIPKIGSRLQESWIEIEPEIQKLVESSPIRALAKAIDLSYDHANLFQGARIITDIRPIFNDSDDQMEIDGAVISYTLRLHYDNRECEHSLSIALDEVDIRVLQQQCERAIKKAEMSKAVMQKTETPTIISGDAR